MTKRLLVVLAATLALLAVTMSPAEAHSEGRDRQPVTTHPLCFDTVTLVDCLDEDLEKVTSSETIGRSKLVRNSRSIRATLRLEDLKPGGVYTVWIIAVQPDDGLFVARGAGFVVRKSGKKTVRVAARVGDPSIEGFLIPFESLQDTKNSTVVFEIAYHGQVADAGPDLGAWLSNFWDGDPAVCPGPFDPNPHTVQLHCPTLYAAAHAP